MIDWVDVKEQMKRVAPEDEEIALSIAISLDSISKSLLEIRDELIKQTEKESYWGQGLNVR